MKKIEEISHKDHERGKGFEDKGRNIEEFLSRTYRIFCTYLSLFVLVRVVRGKNKKENSLEKIEFISKDSYDQLAKKNGCMHIQPLKPLRLLFPHCY